MIKKVTSAVRLALLASSAAALALSNAAYAAEEDAADEEQEKITVTGSRIKREGVDTVYPAISIDAEELRNRAFTNVADALNEISTFGNPDATPRGGQNGNNVGQNFVDFLGLGAQRTLTLVNGRRFVSANQPNIFGVSGGLQVDFNVIPIALVDRIETIGVGGAPTYGSDAIAGTVNVILKDDFEGLDFNFQTGQSEKGDGEFNQVQITGGANFSNGRGNVTFSAEHFEQQGLLQNARPRYTQDDPFFSATGLSSAGGSLFQIYRNQNINIFNYAGLVSPGTAIIPSNGVTGAIAGGFWTFDSGSNIIPYAPGTAIPGQNAFFANGGDTVDFFDDVAQIQSPLERNVFTSRLTYDVTDDVTYSADFLFANTEATELVNQGGFQSFAFGGTSGPLTFPADHPLLSQQARDFFAANGLTSFGLNRFNNDVIDSSNNREQSVWRFTQSLEGVFELADREFNWDVAYVHGRSDGETANQGIIDERFLNALEVRQLTQADVDAAGGSINILSVSGTPTANAGDVVCEAAYQAALGNVTGASGAGVTDGDLPFVQGCVPLNLFGEGVADPAALAWVTGDLMTMGDIEQTVYTANLGGELFDLPGGAAAFNVGMEKRYEQAFFNSGIGAAVPLTRSSAILPTGGKYDTDELYAEVLLPVLTDSDIPGLNMLEFSLSARDIDNSLAGSFTASTIGFRWKPIEELTFRANTTDSLRAPSLAELF
ncbi:MAG: TonB-dependent receptor plug domain-containing protein, partial [Kangiellaceae bacterium]|nr:TonB-dependent receptor plug domain-containing protein [Kangiellaceae bacterium]